MAALWQLTRVGSVVTVFPPVHRQTSVAWLAQGKRAVRPRLGICFTPATPFAVNNESTNLPVPRFNADRRKQMDRASSLRSRGLNKRIRITTVPSAQTNVLAQHPQRHKKRAPHDPKAANITATNNTQQQQPPTVKNSPTPGGGCRSPRHPRTNKQTTHPLCQLVPALVKGGRSAHDGRTGVHAVGWRCRVRCSSSAAAVAARV